MVQYRLAYNIRRLHSVVIIIIYIWLIISILYGIKLLLLKSNVADLKFMNEKIICKIIGIYNYVCACF